MSNVISFPGRKDGESIPSILTSQDAFVISKQEDELFMELVREWPCFDWLPSDVSLKRLLELYYDDELDLSQDCALEFMFHMHDPQSFFDIGNALYSWDDVDREYFFLSLQMHAELIDQFKAEEDI